MAPQWSVLAGEQHGRLQVIHHLAKLGEFADDFRRDVFALAAQLKQCVDIADQRGDSGILVECRFQALALLHQLLAGFLVVPEIGLRDLLFDLRQLLLFGGNVKDSSAQLPIAGGATCIPARVLRGSCLYGTSGPPEYPICVY